MGVRRVLHAAGVRGRNAISGRDSVWGLSLEVAGILAMIVSFTLLGRTLGPAGFGAYASLYAVIGPLVTLAASGVTLALLEHAIRNQESLAATARSCMSLSMVLGVLLFFVGGVIASFIVESLTTVAIVTILLTEFVTTPLIHIAAGTVQAGRNYTGAAQIRLALVALRLVALVLLYAIGVLSVATLGSVHLFSTAVLAVVVLHRVGRDFGFAFLPGRINFHHLRTNFVYSSGISAFAVQNDGDKVVLAAKGFAVDTGLYAAAYRVVLLGMVPVSTVTEVTHRRFLEGGDGGSGAHLRLAVKFGGVLAVYGVVLMLALLIAAPALPLVLGEAFEGSVEMVRWLSPLVLLKALAMFALNGLMGLGRTPLRTVIIAVVAAFGVVLYLVLIPRYGWEGAAIGTLISESTLVAASWIALVLCQRSADRRLVEPESQTVVHSVS